MANAMNISKVTNDDEGIRLDRWFKRHFKDVPFGMIAKMVRKGAIKVNSKKSDINVKLAEGDVILYPKFEIEDQPERPKTKSNKKIEQLIIDSILFKDDKIIVLNKPSGLAVQGGSKIPYSVDDLSDCLKFGYEDKPKLVHRLDKDTSGILVLARKANIAAKLSDIFKKKKLSKKYLAILNGVPKPHVGKIDIPLEKVQKNNFEKVRKTHNTLRRAVSFYRVLDFAERKIALVEFDLVTGRTHQLRVHSSLIDCPILGDTKYGYQDNVYGNIKDKLYLHAYKIEFELEGRVYKFKAQPHEDFKETLNTLGLNVTS